MKRLLTALIVAGILSGCNSEQGSQTKTTTATAPDTAPQVDPPVLVPEPASPVLPKPPFVETPSTPLQPLVPAAPTEPATPPLPIFIGEGITTHTQQPYSGTLTKGGDSYLRYNQDAQYFNDFELPEWNVTYRYEPILEVLITGGTETLCARYSWKLKGFGYARPVCLWSDVRAAVPLEDMQSAYYGFRVIESRVWVSGVVGLSIDVN